MPRGGDLRWQRPTPSTTDPVTGEVDPSACLIPALRVEGSGQAAFRSAFGRAAQRAGIVLADNELFPHGQRAAACSASPGHGGQERRRRETFHAPVFRARLLACGFLSDVVGGA